MAALCNTAGHDIFLPCGFFFYLLLPLLLLFFLTENQVKLECGPMSNVMAALPNIGGALCSTPQSLADADY